MFPATVTMVAVRRIDAVSRRQPGRAGSASPLAHQPHGQRVASARDERHAETFDMPPFYVLMSDQRIADVVGFIA